MATVSPEDLFDTKELMTALQGQPLMTNRMLLLHRHQQQVMLNEQKQVEKKQMPMRQVADDQLDSMRTMMHPFVAEPKKKKLTILEQLQADVDAWLKDSLKII